VSRRHFPLVHLRKVFAPAFRLQSRRINSLGEQVASELVAHPDPGEGYQWIGPQGKPWPSVYFLA
jgi:hypothetical protein